MRILGLLLLAPLLASAQQQEIQRALVERDQQSAEFAAGVNRPALEALHEWQRREAGRPLHADPLIARELRPYERARMAQERAAFVLRLPPPRVKSGSDPDFRPLPLPGGPRHGVEPVPAQGVGG